MKTAICSVIVFAVLLFAGGVSAQEAKVELVNNLLEALDTTKGDGRMLFVMLMSETDKNCEALQEMVDKNELDLPADKYLCVRLKAEDKWDTKVFRDNFSVKTSALPLVAIADSNGKQLATRSGPGKVADYKKLVSDALAKAAKTKKPAGKDKAK